MTQSRRPTLSYSSRSRGGGFDIRQGGNIVEITRPPFREAPSLAHACEAHKNHSPKNRTSEAHHYTPQAWQILVSGNVYDKRTVWLCPTGHRNVHSFIVQIMHKLDEYIQSGHESGLDLLEVVTDAVRHDNRLKENSAELIIAHEAPWRWLQSEHDLAVLIAAKEWGEA